MKYNISTLGNPSNLLTVVREFKEIGTRKVTFALLRLRGKKSLTHIDYANDINAALKNADETTRKEIWSGLSKDIQYTVLYPHEDFDHELFRILQLEIEYVYKAYIHRYTLSQPAFNGWNRKFQSYEGDSGEELVKILIRLTQNERLLFFQHIDVRILFSIVFEEIRSYYNSEESEHQELALSLYYDDVAPAELVLLHYIQTQCRSVANELRAMFIGVSGRDYEETKQAKFELDQRNFNSFQEEYQLVNENSDNEEE